jgi:hypothetical protein
VFHRKLDEEKRQKEEELKELNDYRAKVAELQEINSENVSLHSMIVDHNSKQNLHFAETSSNRRS